MTNNAVSNFKRKEKKYLLDEEQYKKIYPLIQNNMDRDLHFKSTICNIYYDTEDYRLINRSIEKPLYKEKLRIRTYLSEDWNRYTFAEMKKKYNGIVYKRRIGADYANIQSFLKTAAEDSAEAALADFYNSKRKEGLSYGDKQIAGEIAWMTQRYKIKPMLWIGYKRTSYKARDGSDLRITFDRDIIYREGNTDLSLYEGEQLFDYPYCLMEIKTAQGAPEWLCNLLSENKIYPYSFSKCGRIYKDKISSRYLMEE